MSENDIIAKYIKEKHPCLLKTTDFALYKLGVHLSNMADEISHGLSEFINNIDWGKVKELADKLEQDKKEV